MIKKVCFVVLACFQWMRYSVATINIQQRPSAGGYYTLLVDFSMLSESCANETIDVISKSYSVGSGGFTGTSCYELNETYSKCDLIFVEYQSACEANGGKYNSSIWASELENETIFYTCVSNSNGKFYTTDVSTRDYPFCTGISCTESEVRMAFDATILADANSGELRAIAENACRIHPFGKSIAYNRYNSDITFIYITLATISIAVLSQ